MPWLWHFEELERCMKFRVCSKSVRCKASQNRRLRRAMVTSQGVNFGDNAADYAISTNAIEGVEPV